MPRHQAASPPGGAATQEEIEAAALQFVRKISGYRSPSRANQVAFEVAVHDIAAISRRLLEELAPTGTKAPSSWLLVLRVAYAAGFWKEAACQIRAKKLP